MKLKSKILSLVLSLLLIALNVGIPVFRHYCHMMESKTFSTTAETCCSSEKPDGPVVRSVCCETKFLGAETNKTFYILEKENLFQHTHFSFSTTEPFISDCEKINNYSFLSLENSIHNKDIPILNSTLRI
jgi:hypothetical protein